MYDVSGSWLHGVVSIDTLSFGGAITKTAHAEVDISCSKPLAYGIRSEREHLPTLVYFVIMDL